MNSISSVLLLIAFISACSSQKKVSAGPPAVQLPPPKGVPEELPNDNTPPLKPGIPGFVRFDQQEDAMLQAVNSLSEQDRLQTRFIICSDQFNADGIDAVKPCKDGVTKALNSISQDVDLHDPITIGPASSIVQINLRDFGLTPSKWRLIENADPFKFTSETVRGRTLQFLTQTMRPMINGHVFAETALIKAYYGLQEVPESFIALQQQLGVDLQKSFDVRDPELIVYGMNESVITSNRQFRMVIRADGRFGPLWCTEDINDVQVAPVAIDGQLINQKNLLEAPFPKEARSKKAYVDDAGECIFVKPNKMLGFALFNSAGLRQDFAPTNIVQDTASASRGLSGTIQNSRSCYRCHASGFIPVKDSIGPHIASNTSFNALDKQLGRLFFRSAAVGQAFFKDDNDRFQKAQLDLGIANPTEDPINNLTDKLRLEQDAKQVAGLLGITEDELKIGLQSSTNASAILGSLLQPTGKVNFQALIDGLPVLIVEMNLFKDDE